jgi:polyisoprenoid-binding protein YceI
MTRSCLLGLRAAGAVLVLAALAAPAPAVTLKNDPQHSAVTFRVKHMFTKVNGQFRRFEATIDLDEKSLATSQVTATIQVASIDTGVEARDNDLRSPRFFDVAKYPTMTFVSTGVTDLSGQRGKVRGRLTIRDVSREVVLDAEYLGKVKDPWGNLKYGFQARTVISRKDFGITWNQALEAGGFLVGDEVEIQLDIEAAEAK